MDQVEKDKLKVFAHALLNTHRIYGTSGLVSAFAASPSMCIKNTVCIVHHWLHHVLAEEASKHTPEYAAEAYDKHTEEVTHLKVTKPETE